MTPDVETAGTLAVPIWLAGVGAAVLVVSLLLAIIRAEGVALISSLFRVGLIAVGILCVWLYPEQREGSATGSNPGGERRSFDARRAALMAGAIAPGSALSCLDEIAGEAVEVACEKAVFASPEAVAAGINYVTAQLALLNDGTTYAERGDASYAAELAPLRTALELDRFGIVAHVLGDQGCTPERCDALMRFHDSSKALANLRNHTFEEQVKKYTAIWDRPADGVAATAGPLALPSATGPGDGEKYDFPSSKSTPPVSIMAPEGPPPREATASESADVMPQPLPPRPAPQAPQATPPPAGAEPPAQSAVVTPVPPRRPPRVRAPPPPAAATPQLPPLDARGTPPPRPGPFR
jgi:hypothetical protein